MRPQRHNSRVRRALKAMAREFTRARQLMPEAYSGMNDAIKIQRLIVAGRYTAERACHTKARFAQFAHAEKARGDLETRFHEPGSLQSYPCPFCTGYHLAATPGYRKPVALPPAFSLSTRSPQESTCPS